MKPLSDNQILHSKYKWEFLRRNPKYMHEWEKLQKKLEEKYEDYPPDDGGLTKEEIHFCLKWRIGIPINPDLSYEDWIKFSHIPDEFDEIEYIDSAANGGVLSNYGIDFHRLMFEWINPDLLFDIPLRILDGWSYDHDGEFLHRYVSDKIAESGKLTVKINLNYSKSRLIKEFKTLLDEWKIIYDDAHKKKHFREFCREKDIHSFPIDKNLMKEFEKIYKKKLMQRKQKPERKYHFDNFDDYLKVYDFRKEKVSWANITKKLGLNSTQTARNHYKSACELIDKGIEFYVK